MTDIIVRVLSGGRVTIPKGMLKAAEVQVGDYMIIKQFYGEISLTGAKIVPRKNNGVKRK